MLRLLLLLLLVNGLVPALGEALELAVHYAVAGHVAHGPGETDLEGGKEHGCGPTEHHCRCCVSQSLMPAALPGLVLLEPREAPRTPFVHDAVADATRARLLRPPIRA